MKLVIKNLANMKDLSIEIPHSAIVCNKSATGKTTLAKVLYAFLGGTVDSDLISVGETSGEAILELNGRKYTLQIRKGKAPYVETIVDGSEWADYVVLSEFTFMNSVHQRPHEFSIDTVVSKFVKKPSSLEIDQEISELEGKLESIKAIDTIMKSIAEYEATAKELESELENVTRKLEAAREKIGELGNIVKLVMNLENTKKRLEELKSAEASLEEELKKITVDLSQPAYASDREKSKSLRERIGQLERKLNTVYEVRSAVEAIVKHLNTLAKYVDVLVEVNAFILSNPVDAEAMNTLINDFDIIREELMKYESSLRGDLEKLRNELSSVETRLRKYVEMYQRRETLTAELNRIKEKISEAMREKSRLEAELEKLASTTGKAPAELLREYTERDQELALLLKKKQELEAKLNDTKKVLSNLYSTIEKLKAGGAEEMLARYHELKKAKNTLEAEYQQKKRKFIETFKQTVVELYEEAGVAIPGFDPSTLKFDRKGQTYSKSERFLVATIYTLAIATAAVSIGVKIPYVVIDVFTPLDPRFESGIVKIAKRASKHTRIVLLSTRGEQSIVPL